MEQIFAVFLGLMLQQQAQFMGPPPYEPLTVRPRYSAPQQPYTPQMNHAMMKRPDGSERVERVMHNGSLMDLVVFEDGVVHINYKQPRPSLIPYGVGEGSMLVYGQWNNDRSFTGKAHVYSSCGLRDYDVTGRVEHGVFTLQGPAPRFHPGTCIVADYSWNANSYLRFERAP